MDIRTSPQPNGFKYSARSRQQLDTCHPLLQAVFNEVILHTDCTILEGHRGKEKQDEAFNNGFSKLRFPHSKHNRFPSHAVDAVPFPIDWKDTQRMTLFIGKVLGIASQLLKGTGYKLISGIDWNDNGHIKDHSFLDYPHFELVRL